MSQRIPQSFIDELLARIDLVDVIASRIKLKKTGKNYSACCPFHNEKTPSFSVSPDKQFYHCFGCGCSGSALKFIMEFDGLSFPDAVDTLAAQAGLEVPKEQASHQQIQQQQEQAPLFELMQQAGQFYERMLRNHSDNARAIAYLKSRGLSGKAAKFFGVGLAPSGWDNLLTALNPNNDKQITKQLIACGMLIEKEDGRLYDRFRERIMFPIRDVRGRYIAFGGRVLTDEKPKYLNSPETPIFHKGQELYGLYEARKIRQKLTRIVLVEGYMDVVALAEYGIHYAVATLGTATSEHHLRRLFKIVSEVIFCFDGDNAGRTAAARAMEAVLPLLEDGLQARFLFLPEGEDPDTLVRKEGKAAFEERLNHAIYLPEFLFEHLKQQVDFNSMNGKARLDQLAAPLINRLPLGTLRNLMKKQLETELGTTSSALGKLAQSPAQPAIPTTLPQATITESDKPTYSAFSHADYPSQVARALLDLSQHPSLANDIALEELDIEPQNEGEQLLLLSLSKLKAQPQSSRTGFLMLWIGSPYQNYFAELANTNTLPLPSGTGALNNALKLLQARKLQDEYQRLDQKYQQHQLQDNDERQRYLELTKQLNKLYEKRARNKSH